MTSWKRLVTPILLWHDTSRNNVAIGIWIAMQSVLTLWTIHIIAMVAGHDDLFAIVGSAVAGTVFLAALYTEPSSGVLKTVRWLYVYPAQLATLPLVLAGIAGLWFVRRWWQAAVEAWPTWRPWIRPKTPHADGLNILYVFVGCCFMIVGLLPLFSTLQNPTCYQAGVVGILYIPTIHLTWWFVIRPVLTLALFTVITTRNAITYEAQIPRARAIRGSHEPV